MAPIFRAAWDLQNDLQARHPGQSISISASSYQRVLRPGADAGAAWYRLSVFSVLQQMSKAGALPLPWLSDGKPSEAVFRALAVVPMRGIAVGKPTNSLPFDIEEFSRLIVEQPPSGGPENSQL
jgi:hypothetical protein